jgi:hypothetical protein
MAKENPLDKWRKPGAASAPVVAPVPPPVLVKDSDAGTGDLNPEQDKDPTRFRLHSLEIRPLEGLWALLSYAELMDVLFDGANPSFIALVFTRQLVIIKGRNLKSIVAGLRMRTQWVIEQYDEKNPQDNPYVVESMEFFYQDVPRMIAELRGTKKSPG